MPGCIGPPAHFFQQCFPVFAGQAVSIPVRARVLAAVVKEADVVILCFERLDLALDEVIEYDKVILDDWGISNRKGWFIGASMIGFLRQRHVWYRGWGDR